MRLLSSIGNGMGEASRARSDDGGEPNRDKSRAGEPDRLVFISWLLWGLSRTALLKCSEPHLWNGNNKTSQRVIGRISQKSVFKTVALWQAESRHLVKNNYYFYLLIPEGCRTKGTPGSRGRSVEGVGGRSSCTSHLVTTVVHWLRVGRCMSWGQEEIQFPPLS